ncbi:MAG: class I SAM-dependent methyltransferase [Pyrinomonadaceae bacterium]
MPLKKGVQTSPLIKAVKSKAELIKYRQLLRERNLDFSLPKLTRPWRWYYSLRYLTRPLAIDFNKGFDVYNTIGLISEYAPDKNSPILDLGCFGSEILYALHALGYRNLHGCDLNPRCRRMPFWTSIDYRVADLTRTPYRDSFFSVLTCLSVIEHGVRLTDFIAETKRLLRPGGLLIMTTDYDGTGVKHEIAPEFRMFGRSWTIYDHEKLFELVDEFKSAGFTLLKEDQIDTMHTQRPVRWNGEDYTYVMVALKAGE